MSEDYMRRRVRALCDRLAKGNARVTERDIPPIRAVPRFGAEVRRTRDRLRHQRDVVEVRIRLTNGRWTSWLSTDAAAMRLRDAGYITAATDRLASGHRLDEVRT